MAWIRDTDEQARRRPSDLVMLLVAGTLTVLAGLWAQAQSVLNVNLFNTLNDLAGNMVGLAEAVYALGSVWTALVVIVVLLVARQVRVAWHGALAAAVAWGIAELLNEILGTHDIQGLHVNVRLGDGPSFPVVNVAIITALAFALSPYLVRPLRRIFGLVIVLVSAAAMYLGTGFPADVLGGIFVGFAVAALMRFAFGSPGGKPSIAEVKAALLDVGYDVASIAPARQFGRPRVGDGRRDARRPMPTGRRVRARPARRTSRGEGLAPGDVPRSRCPRVRQSDAAGRTRRVRPDARRARGRQRLAPRQRTGVGGADTAVLLTTPPVGTPIGDLPPERVTDGVLATAWDELGHLHDAGVAHGTVDPLRVVVDDNGRVGLDDFSAADASAEQYWRERDNAALLVMTAQIVGNERAVAAAITSLGKERAAAVIPVVQPAALPGALTRGTKHQGKVLKGLRSDLATATGAEDVAPLKIKRLSLVNIGMLAGILLAVAIAIPSLEGINWSSLQSEFENAHLGLGPPRARPVPTGPDRVGHRAHGLRQQGPAVRPHGAHPARLLVPEPHHAERHRGHRAPDSTTCTSRTSRWRRPGAPWCSAPAWAARSRWACSSSPRPSRRRRSTTEAAATRRAARR